MEVVSWVRGFLFLGKNPEMIIASLACVVLLFFIFRRRDGLPTDWPVIGVMPALSVNAGRMHEWLTEFLGAAGLTVIRHQGGMGLEGGSRRHGRPGSRVHRQLCNDPKGGKVYAAIFNDVLGNGIFNADGES